MRIEIETTTGDSAKGLLPPDRCPFYRPETESCRAALPGLRIEWRRRRNCCSSEDHEDCTIFLGTILRSSLPKSRLEAWPLGQK